MNNPAHSAAIYARYSCDNQSPLSEICCPVMPPRRVWRYARHLDKIVLPVENHGKRSYVATGEWSLIGKERGPAHDPAPLQLDVVAGARFERGQRSIRRGFGCPVALGDDTSDSGICINGQRGG